MLNSGRDVLRRKLPAKKQRDWARGPERNADQWSAERKCGQMDRRSWGRIEERTELDHRNQIAMIDSSSFDEMERRGHTLRRLRWTGAATGEATASAEGPERRKADGSGTPAFTGRTKAPRTPALSRGCRDPCCQLAGDKNQILT